MMASAPERKDIKVLTWNINGLKAKLKKHKTKLLETFDQYDVVLLQETHIGPMDDGKNDKRDWTIMTNALRNNYDLEKLKEVTYNEKKKTMYMTYFSSNSKGVAIIINKPHKLLKAFCEGGDYAWVHVEIDSQKYTFVSVYFHGRGPNLICNLMLKIFYSLKDGLDAFKHGLVIGGDFNTTLDPELDANQKIKGHAPLRDILKDFMSILKLSDVWRKIHPRKRQYTYAHHTKTQSRLDYFFMLERDVKYVRGCDILPKDLSDHCPVSLTLNYPDTDDGNIQQHEE